MTSSVANLYRKLDALQQRLWFRIVASVVFLAVCVAVFGALIGTSYSLDAQRRELLAVLSEVNLVERDEMAVSLLEQGTITLDGRTYGGPRIQDQARGFFTAEGRIGQPNAVANLLVAGEVPAWTPIWLMEQPDTTWMLAILTTGWLLLIVWMNITLPFALTAIGTAVPVLLSWYFGREQAMYAFAGIGLLTFTFVLMMRVLLLLFSYPNQVLAVAHTVLKEASRTRIALVFIVLLLVLLPLLPLGLDHEAPLRFRIQTFISRSLGLTFAIAACMTLFLSCATVAFEIRDRQIWQLVSKPLARFNYLIGKWIGIMSVNLVILTVAGVSIFTFIQYLRSLPVAPGEEGLLDRIAVRDAVLTARVGAQPLYDDLTNEQVRARVEQIVMNDPELSQDDSSLALRRYLADQVRQAYETGQRSIPPMAGRTFYFEGLGAARDAGSTLTLRYRFHILSDDEHKTFPARFQFNEQPELVVDREYVPTMSHVLPIGPNVVAEDGTLAITIFNLFQPGPDQRGIGALNFEKGDFELLYKVGNFEGNFFRAVLVDWVKLAFLAMLGISCATYLSFPVACLLSFTIFMAGTMGPYLALSLQYYTPPPAEAVDWSNIGMVLRWAFQSFVRLLAQVLVTSLRAFGDYKPTQYLVEGRLIPWAGVASSFVKIGLVWSGLALVIGSLVMRYRQLAIYSGHG